MKRLPQRGRIPARRQNGYVQHSEPEPEKYTVAETFPTLKYGSSGIEVERLQQKLFMLGYYKGAMTGKFDRVTEEAVKRFQAAKKLTADGIVGELTREAINTAVRNDEALTGGQEQPTPPPDFGEIYNDMFGKQNTATPPYSPEMATPPTIPREQMPTNPAQPQKTGVLQTLKPGRDINPQQVLVSVLAGTAATFGYQTIAKKPSTLLSAGLFLGGLVLTYGMYESFSEQQKQKLQQGEQQQ